MGEALSPRLEDVFGLLPAAFEWVDAQADILRAEEVLEGTKVGVPRNAGRK